MSYNYCKHKKRNCVLCSIYNGKALCCKIGVPVDRFDKCALLMTNNKLSKVRKFFYDSTEYLEIFGEDSDVG